MMKVWEPARGGTGRAFVGRDRELADLVAGLDDAIGGRVRLVLIAGEPRIGKTWLAEHLAEHAAKRGARVCGFAAGRAGARRRSGPGPSCRGSWPRAWTTGRWRPGWVTGSEQQHLPVGAFGAWFWGLAATGAFFWGMGRLRGNAVRQPFWIGLAVATTVIWGVATVLSIALPVYVTGSDPTRLPIGAMVSPVAAASVNVHSTADL